MAITAVDEMIDYLRTRLERYAHAVADECGQGLTDEARKAEDLFMNIFNEAGKAVGFKFCNLNGVLTSLPTGNEAQLLSKLNFPGVDLADSNNGVCVQITFQSSHFQQKTDSTIKGFYKSGLDTLHTRIWLVFASQMRAPNVKINGHDKNLTHIFGMHDLVEWVRCQRHSYDDNSPIERVYNCVRYWLDSKKPSSLGMFDTDVHHEKAVEYQKEINKISSRVYYTSERSDYCRDIDFEAYTTLKKFTCWRDSVSVGIGSAYKKWSQIPVFRNLEEKIDNIAGSIVRHVENISPGFDYKSIQPWKNSYNLDWTPTGYISFRYGETLSDEELAHCKDIREKLLQLRDLIDKHRMELKEFGKKPY
ncbi:hypothetical protein RMI40_01730 [Pseudomonas protegens]|uniref:hypothetical protein n=1 Tax=Pseudomonas protegens TaxID=380021 RepID=UPI00287C0C2C|nr:hypothetical protein [Pseudomonas protegens]MDS9873559.1 hypothetical protein [Pseudomonas protegens]